MSNTNLRRFNEAILLIARKNGKTIFIAAIYLSEFFLSKGRVDLSSTTDLTAAVLLIIKDNKKFIIHQFFMPSDVIEKRKEEDNVPYYIWVQKGLMTLTEGSQNDFTLVTKWFLDMIRTYEIRPLWVGYDPWNSQYWTKEMEDLGFTMEKIRQGIYTLSEPMKQLKADLKNKKVVYNNNPSKKDKFL